MVLMCLGQWSYLLWKSVRMILNLAISTTLSKKIETGTQGKDRRVHA